MEELLEGSRAAIALEGLTGSPGPEGDDRYELQRKVMVGRYQEIKMLLFLGKDLSRWLQQCVDFAGRSSDSPRRLVEQSFADYVVENAPANVREKLTRWGVTDRRGVFSRAIGIYSMFSDPPPLSSLAPSFVNHYHRYADHAYICFQHLQRYDPVDPSAYEFEIYASEEYSRLLSEQWDRA